MTEAMTYTRMNEIYREYRKIEIGQIKRIPLNTKLHERARGENAYDMIFMIQ